MFLVRHSCFDFAVGADWVLSSDFHWLSDGDLLGGFAGKTGRKEESGSHIVHVCSASGAPPHFQALLFQACKLILYPINIHKIQIILINYQIIFINIRMDHRFLNLLETKGIES